VPGGVKLKKRIEASVESSGDGTLVRRPEANKAENNGGGGVGGGEKLGGVKSWEETKKCD